MELFFLNAKAAIYNVSICVCLPTEVIHCLVSRLYKQLESHRPQTVNMSYCIPGPQEGNVSLIGL